MDRIKNDFYYVKRLLRSIEIITRYLKNKSVNDLLRDDLLWDAIENRFTKIAEDAANLSNEYKASVPSVPWPSIITIRNKVCHNYEVVDASDLYKTVKNDFPWFRKALLDTCPVTYMNLCPEPFSLIEAKKKTVEMRLFDEKRSGLSIGDIIVFTQIETKQEMICEISWLTKFPTFQELYAHYDKTELGYREDETADPDDMLIYYSKQNIEKYGVLAVEIKPY